MSSLIFPLRAVGAIIRSKEPVTDTRIDTAVSGKEARSTWQSIPRWRYKIGFGSVRSDTRQDYQHLVGHFLKHLGQLDSFLLRDPEDCLSYYQCFGIGDGVTTSFQIQRALLGKVYDGTGGPWGFTTKPRKNLCLRSNEMGTAPWSTAGGTLTPNTGRPVEGTPAQTANTLYDNAGLGYHGIYQDITLAAYKQHSFSVYVSPIEGYQLQLEAGAALGKAFFDLNANTATVVSGSGVQAYITSCVDQMRYGWWRCEMIYGSNGAASYSHIINTGQGGVAYYEGHEENQLLLCNAQVEQFHTGAVGDGGRATPYIATAGSIVTVNPVHYPLVGDGFEPVFDAREVYIYKDDTEMTWSTEWTISSTGVITFATPPAAGTRLTWEGTYYKRVRFEDPNLSMERIVESMWANELSLITVKP